jgi:hypothetical protein
MVHTKHHLLFKILRIKQISIATQRRSSRVLDNAHNTQQTQQDAAVRSSSCNITQVCSMVVVHFLKGITSLSLRSYSLSLSSSTPSRSHLCLVSNKLYLLRGVSGSGKSYLAGQLVGSIFLLFMFLFLSLSISSLHNSFPFLPYYSPYRSTIICIFLINQSTGVILSTDDFFMNPVTGNYDYNNQSLPKAHYWYDFQNNKHYGSFLIFYLRNQVRAKMMMEKGVTPIIIDNTNLSAWEAHPYVALAEKYNQLSALFSPSPPLPSPPFSLLPTTHLCNSY